MDTRVSQAVRRQREWERGLIGVYKKFLETCEQEIKGELLLMLNVCSD